MCPFGDIMDVPDSCDEKVGFCIARSSCPICPLSKTVKHLSVPCPSAELQSVTDYKTSRPTDRATSSEPRATQALLSKSWA